MRRSQGKRLSCHRPSADVGRNLARGVGVGSVGRIAGNLEGYAESAACTRLQAASAQDEGADAAHRRAPSAGIDRQADRHQAGERGVQVVREGDVGSGKTPIQVPNRELQGHGAAGGCRAPSRRRTCLYPEVGALPASCAPPSGPTATRDGRDQHRRTRVFVSRFDRIDTSTARGIP